MRAKPDDDVRRVILVDLHELLMVDHLVHDVAHVVGASGVLRDQVPQVGFPAIDRVIGGVLRGVVDVVARQVAQKVAHLIYAFLLRLADEVGHTTASGVSGGSSQLFVSHLFPGNGLDDIGTGNIHLADILNHEDEVGDGRRIDRTASGRADDDRDLRDNAGIQGVAKKDVSVGREG